MGRERKVDLDEAIRIVLNEESRHKLMLSLLKSDNAAFMIKQGGNTEKATDQVRQPHLVKEKIRYLIFEIICGAHIVENLIAPEIGAINFMADQKPLEVKHIYSGATCKSDF